MESVFCFDAMTGKDDSNCPIIVKRAIPAKSEKVARYILAWEYGNEIEFVREFVLVKSSPIA